MPRLDGTGPDGQGSMTGRGMGRCTAADMWDKNSFFGKIFRTCCGRGKRNRFFMTGLPYRSKKSEETDIELLKERAETLKNELEKLNSLINKNEQK